MFSPKIQSLDEKIILSIQKFRIKPISLIMILFTWTGMGKFWISVSLFLNIIQQYFVAFNPYILKAFFAPLLVWGINFFLKKIVGRDRPWKANQNILPLAKVPTCDSFPSSHAGSTFSFFFVLMWWKFPEAHWFGIWAGIVSLSRMYLGMHYFTDILGGIAVGLLASGVVYFIF